MSKILMQELNFISWNIKFEKLKNYPLVSCFHEALPGVIELMQVNQ